MRTFGETLGELAGHDIVQWRGDLERRVAGEVAFNRTGLGSKLDAMKRILGFGVAGTERKSCCEDPNASTRRPSTRTTDPRSSDDISPA